jgi:cytoskeletal protein CcmA (bactofilin family)
MWFNKKKPPPIRSLVGEGMLVTGELRFAEGLRVDGEVFGDVLAEGAHSLLIVSENARIHGKVRASHVIINGEIKGPVFCDEMLELQPKARIVGDVRYEVMEMHPGALIDGELRPMKSGDKPALKLAASNEA